MDKIKKRQIFMAASALAAVVSLLAGWYFTLRKGVYAGADFYTKVSDTRYVHDSTSYIERLSDAEYKVASRAGEDRISLQAEGDTLTFSFSDGTSRTLLWNGSFLVETDGLPLMDIGITFNDDSVETSHAAYCQTLCRIHYGIYDTISKWYIQAFGLLIYLGGIFTILRPDDAHFFLGKWRYEHPELSDAGRLTERIGGALLSLLGIGFMTGIVFLFVH